MFFFFFFNKKEGGGDKLKRSPKIPYGKPYRKKKKKRIGGKLSIVVTA
jgi:hypothetical protein